LQPAPAATDDAIILDRSTSRAFRYTTHRGLVVDISWRGFKGLGIWSKPGGAPFLCIEPWHGFASPVDFDGEFSDNPA
jgi:galactose mutarotase-like enzyme